MKDKNNPNRKKEEEMSSLTKPTVYEIKITQKNRDKILKEINEPRLTKDFVEKCIKTAERLREDSDK